MKRTKKGISLIVLIITIAVIIVLASAVILSIANNRPIESAKEATKSHNETVLKENAAVLSAQWKTDSLLGNTTMSRSEYVKQGLSSQGFTEEEVESVVVDDETGETKIIEKGGAIDVASNPNKYYGAEVTNYTENSNSNVGWKIFYSDESNIYLIASDYISRSYAPNKNGSSLTGGDGSSDYLVRFSPVISYYKGSEDITDSRLRSLNSGYFAYLKLSGKTSTNNNMKAIAYMMDTEIWSRFKGENAEYVIGGPTFEMFIKSYKQKHPESQLEYQITDVSSSYTALNGYSYRKGSSGRWNSYIGSAFSTSDSLYIITNSSKAGSLWLASPSVSGDGGSLSVINNAGGLGYADYISSSGSGLRPLVCLKSSVKLEEQGSGKYAIK